MPTRLATACLLAALLPAIGRAQSADAIDAPRITQAAFKKLLAANNVIVVDTRHTEAFDESRIRGALPLPLEGRMTWPDEFEKTVAVLLKTKKPVVTYCA